ncbi:MAG: hypothetical protein ACN4EH_01330 [Methyloceanibacter sp.]
MLTQLYRLVMNPSENPLRTLPPIVRFQFMVILSYMWSAIFALWIGYMWLMGPSIIAHTFLLVGVFFTSEIFALASNQSKRFLQKAAAR